MPDLRGLFLRGYGSQSNTQNNGSSVGTTSTTHASGALKTVQGDAMRRTMGNGSISGTTGINNTLIMWKGTGVFQGNQQKSMWTFGNNHAVNSYGSDSLEFNLANSLPTANEIRPVNMAVRYLIRALP